MMFARHLQTAIADSLTDTPAVLLIGARQTGKTTLAQAIAARQPDSTYISFDDLTALEAATTDPVGFVGRLRGLTVLDEIQKAPKLLPAIKASIDRDRQPGRFLLTGSANVLTLPKVSESLAGRIEVVSLWPLSQGELEGRRESFIDDVLHNDLPTRQPNAEDVLPRLLVGGYPEAVARTRPDRRRAFFEAYVTTLLTRDVRDIAAIENPGLLRRLLRLIAARSASLANHAELSRTLGMPVATLKRYLALLETLFLVHEVPAWSANRGQRLARAPKLHLADTGLLTVLVGIDDKAIRRDRRLVGPVLESFVAAELSKQISWSNTRPVLHHFRTHAGHEVDLVLEDARGQVVGIEIKASATVTASDFGGLKALALTAGSTFVQGLVLYLGAERVPFGAGLTACPVTAVWA